MTNNQNNSIENILITAGKSIKTWDPWGTFPGTDTYILFNKNYLSLGVKTNNLSNSTSNITLNSWNLISSTIISGTIVDSDIILGNNTVFSSTNTNKVPIIISSKNSVVDQNILNTVILGGSDLQARISNTVMVPKISFQNKSISDINHNTLTNDSYHSLYNLNGTLYWNGSAVTTTPVVSLLLPTPSINYSTLYSNGTIWLENINLLNDTSIGQIRIVSPNVSKTTFKVASNTASGIYGRVQLEYLGYESTTSYTGFIVSDNTGNLNRFALSNSTKFLRGDGTWQDISSLIPISSIVNGILTNQTLRWTGSAWSYTNSLMTNATGQVSIGNVTIAMDALTKLQVNGGILLMDIASAPVPVTNKLYSIGGVLYWNGISLAKYPGSVLGSHLKWNGTTYIEQLDFLTVSGINNSTNNKFISNDTAGINTLLEIGTSSITTYRGLNFNISEPGNLTAGYLSFSQNYGNTAEFKLNIADNNIPKYTDITVNADTIVSTIDDSVYNTQITQYSDTYKINANITNKVNIISSNTLLTNQYICAVQTGTGSYTLTLPASSAHIDGRTYIIKDVDDNANTNNIIILPSGASTIDGQPSYTITVDSDKVMLCYILTLDIWIKI